MPAVDDLLVAAVPRLRASTSIWLTESTEAWGSGARAPFLESEAIMSDVPSNRFLIQIMSVGYRHFMQDHDFTQDDLERRIKRISVTQCPYLILGVLHFTDPGHDRSLRDHVGKHPEILRSVTTAMLAEGAPAMLAAALRQRQSAHHCLVAGRANTGQ